MFVMVLGVGLFGVLTGFLANAFLSPKADEPETNSGPVSAQSQIAEFKRLLEEQERVNSALKTRLSEIETVLESGAGAG